MSTTLHTPICPHSFFNRAVVFKSTEQLEIFNIGTADLNITVDGRLFKSLRTGESAVITTAIKRLKVICFGENNMFSTLFGKIKLIEDIT